MKLKVLDITGKQTGRTVDLSDDVFGVAPHDHSIWLDVRAIRANGRQGTHKAKGRSEVSGGGKKPFRQKGTGRARQGTIRAPHHVGGGTVFGPEPRTYSLGVNRKVKQLARKSALSYKAKGENIVVVENFSFEEPKTKKVQEILKALNVAGEAVLLLTAANDANLNVSANNLYRVSVKESVTFSTYDVLRAGKVVVQEGAVAKINEVLAK
ncbi:MAG: 50S ribosomal protein L4 [Calditrichales bacterium]|nr:MAG: 50S ribosomal protein L4 [Calditrichales bacterium]